MTPPPTRTKVNPLIYADEVVVVRKKLDDKFYTDTKRRLVRLVADSSFDGKGTFSVSGDAVTFYKSETGTDTLKFDGKDNVFPGDKLTAGISVWVEGTKPSGAPEDIKLKLSFSGGSKPTGPDAVEVMTSVELLLDICKSRPNGGGEPPVMTQKDKIDKGRYLLPQKDTPEAIDPKFDASLERAMLIVKKAKPEAWEGKLVLAPQGGLRLFEKEKPEAGEAPIAMPFTIANADVPAEGKKFWVEGVSASKKLRDARYSLGVDGLEPEGDWVHLTMLDLVLEICQPILFTAQRVPIPG